MTTNGNVKKTINGETKNYDTEGADNEKQQKKKDYLDSDDNEGLERQATSLRKLNLEDSKEDEIVEEEFNKGG